MHWRIGRTEPHVTKRVDRAGAASRALHEAIQRIAYAKWESDGCPQGLPAHYWRLAEEEVAKQLWATDAHEHGSSGIANIFRRLGAQPDADSDHGISFAQLMLVPVVGAFFYFTGWMYLYHFFKDFGLDILTVNIPTYNVFVYSLAVGRYLVETYFGTVILVVFLIVLSSFLISRVKHLRTPYALCLIVLLFFLGRFSAIEAAYADAESLRSAPGSLVEFVFKEPDDVPSDAYMETLKQVDPAFGLPILLLQTDDQYFVFVDTAQRSLNVPRLLQIGRSEVLMAKTRRP